MYKLVFKGSGLEPLFVDDVKGQIVWDSWIAKNKARMVLGDTAFYTEDIKQIIKIQKTEAESAPKVQAYEAEYLEFRRKMLSLPIDRRASILRIPKMLWASTTKQEMPDVTKEEIKQRQLAYFEENPNCIYANPKVYRDLIIKHAPLREIENMKPIQNVLPAAMLRMVEELIRTDLQYSVR